jgi:hypothetical protein
LKTNASIEVLISNTGNVAKNDAAAALTLSMNAPVVDPPVVVVESIEPSPLDVVDDPSSVVDDPSVVDEVVAVVEPTSAVMDIVVVVVEPTLLLVAAVNNVDPSVVVAVFDVETLASVVVGDVVVLG